MTRTLRGVATGLTVVAALTLGSTAAHAEVTSSSDSAGVIPGPVLDMIKGIQKAIKDGILKLENGKLVPSGKK
jgi:hypothetical protein